MVLQFSHAWGEGDLCGGRPRPARPRPPPPRDPCDSRTQERWRGAGAAPGAETVSGATAIALEDSAEAQDPGRRKAPETRLKVSRHLPCPAQGRWGKGHVPCCDGRTEDAVPRQRGAPSLPAPPGLQTWGSVELELSWGASWTPTTSQRAAGRRPVHSGEQKMGLRPGRGQEGTMGGWMGRAERCQSLRPRLGPTWGTAHWTSRSRRLNVSECTDRVSWQASSAGTRPALPDPSGPVGSQLRPFH